MLSSVLIGAFLLVQADDLLVVESADLPTYWERVRDAAPEYPTRAARAGIEGCARLGFVIEADGTIGSIKTLAEHPAGRRFARAARQAVQKWRYTPGPDNGDALAVYTATTISFMLGINSTAADRERIEAPCNSPDQ